MTLAAGALSGIRRCIFSPLMATVNSFDCAVLIKMSATSPQYVFKFESRRCLSFHRFQGHFGIEGNGMLGFPEWTDSIPLNLKQASMI